MKRSAFTWLFFAVLLSGAISGATIVLEAGQDRVLLRMTPWLFARSAGVTSYLLLTTLVIVGLVLSSVPNREQWRASRTLLPLHRLLSLFLIGFLAVHVTAVVLDSYAKVGVIGAFVPFLSGYRAVPVALGTLALYSVLLLSLTARFRWLLPNSRWLTVHRFSLLAFVLAFVHGVQTGTDTPGLRWMYDVTGLSVMAAAFLRYAFVSRKERSGRNRPGRSSDPA